MTKLLPPGISLFLLSYVLLVIGFALPPLFFPDSKLFGFIATFGYVGVVSIMLTMLFLYWRENRLNKSGLNFDRIYNFLDKYAVTLLIIWIIVYLTWCGLELFSNPFQLGFNHGDAAAQVQILWNMVNGLKPEISLFTFNGLPLTVDDDPRYFQSYGYVSIFSINQYFLPMAVLSPLYAIFPHPPMHLFSIQIFVITVGLPGVYWAVRCAGGTNSFALLAAIGYSTLPQVGVLLFFQGNLDVIGLGVLPWLFGALFARKWVLMCFFAFIVGSISFAYTNFVIIFGLFVLIFSRAAIVGVAVMLIGCGLTIFDTAVFNAAANSYYSTQENTPSFFKTYVLNRTIGSLIPPFVINLAYVFSLLQGLAFLPLIALRWGKRWNITMLGLWFLLGLAFFSMMFRGYGWEFQRNGIFIVPIFMMGVTACIGLQIHLKNDHKLIGINYSGYPSIFLFFCMLSTILIGNPYRSPTLASHFPWGKNATIKTSVETLEWEQTLKRFNNLVPKDAPIAWRANPVVQTFLTNRQHSWWIGREPKEVKYYVFLGEAGTPKEKTEWESKIASLRNDTNFKIISEENPGKPILLFENLHARPIRRNENELGWSILLRAIGIKNESL